MLGINSASHIFFCKKSFTKILFLIFSLMMRISSKPHNAKRLKFQINLRISDAFSQEHEVSHELSEKNAHKSEKRKHLDGNQPSSLWILCPIVFVGRNLFWKIFSSDKFLKKLPHTHIKCQNVSSISPLAVSFSTRAEETWIEEFVFCFSSATGHLNH